MVARETQSLMVVRVSEERIVEDRVIRFLDLSAGGSCVGWLASSVDEEEPGVPGFPQKVR